MITINDTWNFSKDLIVNDVSIGRIVDFVNEQQLALEQLESRIEILEEKLTRKVY